MTTELHSFCHGTEWPESVQMLVGLLGRPLPRTEDLMSLSSMSPLSHSQLEQISAESHSISLDESKLSSVANTVLLTSAAIKESMDRRIGPSHTIHHWFTLIKIIAHVTYRGAEVIGDVPIVYPSGFHIERGVASMLVTLPGSESLLSEILRYYSEPEETPNDGHATLTRDELMPHSGKSCSDMNDDDSMEDDDVDDSEENLSETSEERDHRFLTAMPDFPKPVDIDRLFFDLGTPEEHEPQASPFLEFPLSAHILSGRCAWPNLPFPVLCLTSDNIIPLLASVAYQRRTWGIELPAVGFQLSETGSLVHTYIAWIDPLSDFKCRPTVHLLCPASEEAFSSPLPKGVFDLSDPQSSLKFSQFVLSLDYQFDALRNELPSKQRLSDLKWRSDDDNAPWSADVNTWRASINVSDGSSTTETSTTSLPITPISDQPDFAAFPIAMAPGSEDSANNKKTLKKGSVGESKVDTSCSGFAKEKSETILKRGSITSFMAYRYTFSLARVFNWKSKKHDPPEFQSMLSRYEDISCFSWPPEWKDIDSMPVTDEWANSYVKNLFQRYREEYPNLGKVPDPLDATLTKIIGGRLSLLMKSTEGSYVTEARPIQPKEAECRHNFDALFSNFFVESAMEGSSPEVFLECQIRLAENTLSRKLQDIGVSDSADQAADEALDDLVKHFQRWQKHCDTLSTRVQEKSSGYSQDFKAQCRATDDASTLLKNEVIALRDMGVSSARPKVSQPEPVKGVCDALLASVVQIPVTNYKQCSDAYNKSKLAKLDLHTPRRSSQASPSYQHPFSAHSGDYGRKIPRSSSLPPFPSWVDTGSSIIVFLPALLAEYKKTDDDEVKAINQARMYLIAAIAYLAAIGLIMGWRSSNGASYIMERNIRKFDIRDPLQAFHLAIIIMRLKSRGDELKQKVLEDESIQEKFFSSECQQWAMPAKVSSDTSTKLATLRESVDEHAADS
ncbi:hypothetical protein ABKN59_008445 [Abortiporus biennis]